jgi:hypothetical protein
MTVQEHADLQAQLDEQREKDKIPTMDEVLAVVHQVIGGDEDGE